MEPVMNFEEKRSFALKELENSGIWKSNYNPPIVQLIHKLGMQVPFPHYNSFIKNALAMGIFFGAVWGLLMYFFVWRYLNTPVAVMVLTPIGAGVFFGVAMAAYYRHGFKKYKLTPWDEMKNN
jgi:hypothetical protein